MILLVRCTLAVFTILLYLLTFYFCRHSPRFSSFSRQCMKNANVASSPAIDIIVAIKHLPYFLSCLYLSNAFRCFLRHDFKRACRSKNFLPQNNSEQYACDVARDANLLPLCHFSYICLPQSVKRMHMNK